MGLLFISDVYAAVEGVRGAGAHVKRASAECSIFLAAKIELALEKK